MQGQILNTLGLGMTICGCFVLYHFGLPAAIDPTGSVRITLEQPDEEEISTGKRYRRLGRLGIGLIAAGSGFQIWATWVA